MTVHIGLTSDFVDDEGNIALDKAAMDRLRSFPGTALGSILGRPSNAPLQIDDVEQFDILVTKRNRLTRDLLMSPQLRLKHVARLGVGYDHIDLDACRKAGVTVSITPDAVRRPVASSIVALILALAHRIRERDRLARNGNWSTRHNLVGTGLKGRALGLIGAGNIGLEVLRLIAPFEMRALVSDPERTAEDLAAFSASLVPLEDLLRQADFVALACPLMAETYHLINAERLGLMKSTAFLVNMARGELVDETALTEALLNGRIGGAAIDVYEQEPPAPDNPLLDLPNVILGQHNLAHTDEVKRLGEASAVSAVHDIVEGRMPRHTINPETWVETSARYARH